MKSRLNVLTIYLPSLTRSEPLQTELKLVGVTILSHPSPRYTLLLFLQLKLELEFAIHINATLICLDVVSASIHSTQVLAFRYLPSERQCHQADCRLEIWSGHPDSILQPRCSRCHHDGFSRDIFRCLPAV